jgi:hypothetical protein
MFERVVKVNDETSPHSVETNEGMAHASEYSEGGPINEVGKSVQG